MCAVTSELYDTVYQVFPQVSGSWSSDQHFTEAKYKSLTMRRVGVKNTKIELYQSWG